MSIDSILHENEASLVYKEPVNPLKNNKQKYIIWTVVVLFLTTFAIYYFGKHKANTNISSSTEQSTSSSESKRNELYAKDPLGAGIASYLNLDEIPSYHEEIQGQSRRTTLFSHIASQVVRGVVTTSTGAELLYIAEYIDATSVDGGRGWVVKYVGGKGFACFEGYSAAMNAGCLKKYGISTGAISYRYDTVTKQSSEIKTPYGTLKAAILNDFVNSYEYNGATGIQPSNSYDTCNETSVEVQIKDQHGMINTGTVVLRDGKFFSFQGLKDALYESIPKDGRGHSTTYHGLSGWVQSRQNKKITAKDDLYKIVTSYVNALNSSGISINKEYYERTVMNIVSSQKITQTRKRSCGLDAFVYKNRFNAPGYFYIYESQLNYYRMYNIDIREVPGTGISFDAFLNNLKTCAPSVALFDVYNIGFSAMQSTILGPVDGGGCKVQFLPYREGDNWSSDLNNLSAECSINVEGLKNSFGDWRMLHVILKNDACSGNYIDRLKGYSWYQNRFNLF